MVIKTAMHSTSANMHVITPVNTAGGAARFSSRPFFRVGRAAMGYLHFRIDDV
jgi:hypothetical protein